MTLTPDLNDGNRDAIVRQDLDNVVHPVVPHKLLEEQQLVIVTAKDSTVVDVNGCAVLPNASVEIWHADAGGNYSGFGSAASNRTFLRGAQTTGSEAAIQHIGIPHHHFR